ncbi:arsenate reductase family protein [Psychrobacillus sp. FSL W7-1457]|uniref:arsenate reductase family protein n=1 Tax=Psychrobacillus sp. FSL W7-1457 TaxID=2954547 RepID=UPI00315AA894
MTIQFYGYPKCSTCNKASKWLKDNNIPFENHHIVDAPPSKELLKEMVAQGDNELKKFFNTSGVKYRELQLKDKLPTMSEDEQLELLASDGKLIKRPLVYDGHKLTLGFKEEQFEDMWKTS